MLVNRIALVPGRLPKGAQATVLDEIRAVAASLQTQVARDFRPFWAIDATVTAFASAEDVPLGFWPIFVQTLNDPRDSGYHRDKFHQPYARVAYDPAHPTEWSLTASHEVLEMLADPSGDRLVAGPTIDKRYRHNRVLYALEVCDPCEDTAYSYTIDGVLVSDFITPHYHDPDHSAGARYSYTGAVTRPRQVLPGGYLDWQDPALGYWFEFYYKSANSRIHKTERLPGRGSLREQANALTPHYTTVQQPRGARVAEAHDKRRAGAAASRARARTW
jgi:hypothetical protein